MTISIHAKAPNPRFAELFRCASSFLPTGVAILSADDVTMTVSSLHCVSFDPPMVSVALARDSARGAAVLKAGRFHTRLLRYGEQAVVSGEGVASGLGVGKGVMEMECTVVAVYPAGDHHLALAEVGLVETSLGYPLVYWRRGLHEFRPHYRFLDSREAFDGFVAAWEEGLLAKTDWTHAAHVAVAAAFAVRFGDGAFERMKDGILHFNKAVGTVDGKSSGYHETLTQLWSTVVGKVTEEFSDPWEAARKAVEMLGEARDLHHLYYSFDVVKDADARGRWVPPDLEGPY